MKKILLVLVSFIILFCTGNANAKWWIFGSNPDGINLQYLYLNNTSYLDMNGKAVFFKSSLPNGEIKITGKAKTSSGKIASVQISLDNKETWQKAKISKDGAFEYKFTPKMNEIYNFYLKVIDTSGKTNEVDETYVQISLSEADISDAVRATLDKMFKAYMEKNLSAFMVNVSEDFAGGYEVLDSAIRSDFIALNYIRINYIINNIVQAPNGNVYVSFRFDRTVIGTRSGQSLTDTGITEVSFKNDKGIFKLLTMKQPLMFGLSDAEEVSTGGYTTQTSGTENITIDNGNVMLGDSETGMVVLTICDFDTTSGICNSYTNSCFHFDTGEVVDNLTADGACYTSGGLHNSGSVFYRQQSLGQCDFNATAVPNSGYINSTSGMLGAGSYTGDCFAIDYGSGRILIKMIKSDAYVVPGITQMRFKYKLSN